MKKLLTKLAPDRFEDIIAVLALYRPGPLGSGMVDDFILRKKGQQKIDYFHPDLEAVPGADLRRHRVPGAGDADRADHRRLHAGRRRHAAPGDGQEEGRGDGQAPRRSSSKARPKKGYDPGEGQQLFDLMEKFAEYGFNKSHTAAYAVVTYHTAWLKAHHCAAFMAATLSADMDNTDTGQDLLRRRACQRPPMLPPDVNASDYRFVPVDAQDDPLRPRRRQGHRRAGGERDPRRRAIATGRSRICSTFACASTSAWSTGARSRRWYAPAPSMRSTSRARIWCCLPAWWSVHARR
jgi:DNA polymerase-3 subunit alpha